MNEDNVLVRTKLTTKEIDLIIFLVTKLHQMEEWYNIRSLMPYFEWEIVETIMIYIDHWLDPNNEDMNIHLKVIDAYLEECVRTTFGGMMAEYGV